MYIINGAYGSDEKRKGYWAATGKILKEFKYKDKVYNMKVDFSMKEEKTHKSVYNAYMKNRVIRWEDGNEWKKLYA